MKTVILAGGLGTRLSEETVIRPKPMVEIGGFPILWHIMKIYASHGLKDFIVCCGYKSYVIKEYFANYAPHVSDLRIDMQQNKIEFLNNNAEDWTVTLVETGRDTMTGGRLKRIRDYIGEDEAFCFTYGDGVSDVNITEQIAFHKAHGKLATVTAVEPSGRYGALGLQGSKVVKFMEKPSEGAGWINGGFFVLSPRIFDFIEGDHTSWEVEPLTEITHVGQLEAYLHRGFWQSMDTLRDRTVLEKMWASGNAPWRTWSTPS